MCAACLPQRHCLSGRGGTVSLAALPPDDDVLCHIFQRDQIIRIIQRQTHQIKSSMQKDRCAWSNHAHRLRCKDTPTHSYAMVHTLARLGTHPHRPTQVKYDLPLYTPQPEKAEPVPRAGRCGQATRLASRAPYLLLHASSGGGGGGGGGSSKIRGRDRLLAAPTLE